MRTCVYERLSDREIGIEQNREIDSERVSERHTFFYLHSFTVFDLSFMRGATISCLSVVTVVTADSMIKPPLHNECIQPTSTASIQQYPPPQTEIFGYPA